MHPFDPARVVATREILHGTEPVLISVGCPEQEEQDPGDWFCPYRITGLPEGAVEGYAMGIDSMQALLLAQVRIGDYLSATGADLTFMGTEDLLMPLTEEDRSAGSVRAALRHPI